MDNTKDDSYQYDENSDANGNYSDSDEEYFILEDTGDNDFPVSDDILGPDPGSGTPRVEIMMDPLFDTARDAADFLQGTLLRMGLSGRVAVSFRPGSVYLNITGAEPGLVIGHRGQNLDALQHLVNRAVNKNTNELTPVTVDSDDYRTRRLQQVERMAHSIIREVSDSGESIVTEPLTPSERRLFHIAANRARGIKTASLGDGFFQPIRVVPSFNSRQSHANFRQSSQQDYLNHDYRSGNAYSDEYPEDRVTDYYSQDNE
ncbi:KH domain-containing protein [bacterium]|nr:KH domain-containing protein [candidate division CSSED10-310 bacterium]